MENECSKLGFLGNLEEAVTNLEVIIFNKFEIATVLRRALQAKCRMNFDNHGTKYQLHLTRGYRCSFHAGLGTPLHWNH